MNRFRKRSISNGMPPMRAIRFLALMGFALFVSFRIFTPPTQTVQILEAPDGSRAARLQRVYYYSDPGFKIAIREKRFWSTLCYIPGQTSVPTAALDEKLRWSEDSERLVLEINDTPVWDYDFSGQSKLKSP